MVMKYHSVKRIRIQVLNETGIIRDLIFRNGKLLDDDSFDFFCDGRHSLVSFPILELMQMLLCKAMTYNMHPFFKKSNRFLKITGVFIKFDGLYIKNPPQTLIT